MSGNLPDCVYTRSRIDTIKCKIAVPSVGQHHAAELAGLLHSLCLAFCTQKGAFGESRETRAMKIVSVLLLAHRRDGGWILARIQNASSLSFARVCFAHCEPNHAHVQVDPVDHVEWEPNGNNGPLEVLFGSQR